MKGVLLQKLAIYPKKRAGCRRPHPANTTQTRYTASLLRRWHVQPQQIHCTHDRKGDHRLTFLVDARQLAMPGAGNPFGFPGKPHPDYHGAGFRLAMMRHGQNITTFGLKQPGIHQMLARFQFHPDSPFHIGSLQHLVQQLPGSRIETNG